jgi:hypothetical protein
MVSHLEVSGEIRELLLLRDGPVTIPFIDSADHCECVELLLVDAVSLSSSSSSMPCAPPFIIAVTPLTVGALVGALVVAAII